MGTLLGDTTSDRIAINVLDVRSVIGRVANAVVRELNLPDGSRPGKFFSCAGSEASLHELDSAFKRIPRGNQHVKMLGHQDVFVKQVSTIAIRVESIEEKLSPASDLEQTQATPCGRRDEVGLMIVGRVFSSWSQSSSSLSG